MLFYKNQELLRWTRWTSVPFLYLFSKELMFQINLIVMLHLPSWCLNLIMSARNKYISCFIRHLGLKSCNLCPVWTFRFLIVFCERCRLISHTWVCHLRIIIETLYVFLWQCNPDFKKSFTFSDKEIPSALIIWRQNKMIFFPRKISAMIFIDFHKT